MRRKLGAVLLATAAATGGLTFLGVAPAFAAGQSFTTLQAGFTQELYGVAPNFFGGVAFAPDGDPLVDGCQFSGSSLFRFDSATTLPITNGTSTLHSVTTEPSSAGCGLTNHPNGALYTNTSSGVIKLDVNTGAQLAGPFGPGGRALGITVDPQTGNLVYVLADDTIGFVNPALTSSGTFSSVSGGYDQITFDPSGNFLFLSNDGPNILTILNRSGALVQNVPLTVGSNPDGIAFHSSSPQFVVTNNNNGTMTRFDFPGNDFTKTPTQSLFASGGFRGDMTQVGPDGCLYATQNGTRYDDGTTAGTDSLVRICPGFAPPVGVSTISLSPLSQSAPAGTTATVTATVVDPTSAPLIGASVTLTILSGPDTGQVKTGTTGPGGTIALGIANAGTAGTDTVSASFVDGMGNTQVSNVVSITFSPNAKASPTIATQASPGNLLGAPVRDVATLAGGSTPTGTVTFRLFSDSSCATLVTTSTNAVSGGSATSDWFTPTAAGTYYWSALYNGDATNNTASSACNAPHESVVIAPFAPPTFTRTITGDFLGPLTVNAGDSVLITGARVVGPVTVNPGGVLSVVNSQISRGITANNPKFLSLCGAQVAGPSPAQALGVSNAAVPIRIGDPANGCAGNRFSGDVNLSTNLAITFGANIASRNVNINNNGPGNTVVKANTITLALACAGNIPPPTNAGQINAAASKSGQCSAL